MTTSAPRLFSVEDQKFVTSAATGFSTGSTVWISFPTVNPYPDNSPFQVFDPAQQIVVEEIFALYGQLTGLTFQKWPGPGAAPSRIRLWLDGNMTGGQATADGSFKNIRVGTNGESELSFPLGSYLYFTLLHEIGHVIGLKHPHNSPAGAAFAELPTNDGVGTDESVMSYNNVFRTRRTLPDGGIDWSYPITLQTLDIEALRRLYPTAISINPGQTTYTFRPNAQGVTPQNNATTIYEGQIKNKRYRSRILSRAITCAA
jgi:serralysin